MFAFSAALATAAEREARRTDPTITTAAGFRVERVHRTVAAEGSWVALVVDPKGRLVVSDQYGALYRVTPGPVGQSDSARVEKLALPIGSGQGLAFVGETLFVNVAENVHDGPGLFRVTDADADGELDTVTLLQRLEGTGEHGPHAIVPTPDGRALYVLGGNATRLPELAHEAARRTWDENHLLPPLPATMGSETRGIPPGGWIARADLDGRSWTLMAAGFRNHYAAAFNRDGELFTFDSDTEFEINLPWYRPTRVLHAVSGADFGWRQAAAKLQENSLGTLPAVVAIGFGSPTGVSFGYGAKFPPRYANALFVADWSFGKLHAIQLRPRGASYSGEEREEIIRGTPLPITALAVNPRDGALYFTTGGRRLESALYRLTWVGESTTRSTEVPEESAAAARAVRRELERFHGVRDSSAVNAAWPHLGSNDAFIREAALRAVESQPIVEWREQATREADVRRAMRATFLLARAGDGAAARKVLRRFPIRSLPADLQREKLQVMALALAGTPSSGEERLQLLEEFDAEFPSADRSLNLPLAELLIFLEAPRIIERVLEHMLRAPTREEQIAFATALRNARVGWTPDLRARYFAWFRTAAGFKGGAAFKGAIDRIKKDALANVPANERAQIDSLLSKLVVSAKGSEPGADLLAGRTQRNDWQVADLVPRVEAALRQPRNMAKGRALFGAVGCFSCHQFAGEGGALGPDLSQVRGRMSVRDLLEATIEPSNAVSDQYGTAVVTLKNGAQHVGRLVNQTERQVQLATDLSDPSALQRINHADVQSIVPSTVSLMPPGLLAPLTADEIADLVAFLLRG